MRIKETETRIEQEVAGLRERVEAVKFSTLQWLMCVTLNPGNLLCIVLIYIFFSGVFALVRLL